MGLYAGKAGRQWCLGIACLVGVLLGAAPAFAQFDRGQISGVIKDQTGGVMPGVTVTATQVATQTAHTTVTDASGFYTFPNLSAGRYNISAELQGFKKAVKEGVQLDATGALTMDFSLATGALTEQVTVTAEQTLLQTDTSLRKTVEAKDIEQLSFSGRNPIGVAGLKPGVIGGNFNNFGFSDLGNGGFSMNGSRGRREQHHRGRGDRDPHPIERSDRRDPERRRDPGSADPDRRLHARVRPRQRRSDPHGDQERQQPLQRQRFLLPPDDNAAGEHLGAQPEPELVRKQRRRAVRLQAVRLFDRRAGSVRRD